MTEFCASGVQFVCWFWIGFVSAISFMEAWLKFRAEGVPLDMGLRIGKTVFSGLNRVEVVLTLLLVLLLAVCEGLMDMPSMAYGLIPIVFIVVCQSVYLLPQMNERADQKIRGKELQKSNLHMIYIGSEVVKVVCLFIVALTV